MDLLDGFSRNPLEPAYGPEPEAAYQANVAQEPTWRQHEGGLVEIGHPGGSFHFDNEAPRHRRWLEPFALSSRLVSNGEYAAFIADGGYKRPELWMSEGWAVAQAQGWQGVALLARRRGIFAGGASAAALRAAGAAPELV